MTTPRFEAVTAACCSDARSNPRCTCSIDLLALVEVGAVVGEARLDGVLPSCEKASRHIISGRVFAASSAIVWLFCRRRSRLIVRNPFDQIVGVDVRRRACSARSPARRAA